MIALIITFFVLFILESVLSVDNAAVLAARVKVLPTQSESNKALTYGIWGAYFFRGLLLFGASWLIMNPHIGNYIALLGAFWLFKLVWGHFTPKADTPEEGDIPNWFSSILHFLRLDRLSKFWLVVIEVEFLDLVFSVDNILACVSMSKNIWLIIAAVFAAIATMRFVTQKMTMLMRKFPYLENRAYIVIGLIALKLSLNGLSGIFGIQLMIAIFESHYTDLIFSLCTMLLFLPIGVKKHEYVNPNTI